MPLEQTNPRLQAIIQEVETRQKTQLPGYVPRADAILVAEIRRLEALLNRNLVMVDGRVYDHRDIVRMNEELAEHWWYAMGAECIEKGDGWLCPYMSEAKHASKQLVKIGQAEKHPDHDWYRAVNVPAPKDLTGSWPDPNGGCPLCGGQTETDREDPPNPYICEKCR